MIFDAGGLGCRVWLVLWADELDRKIEMRGCVEDGMYALCQRVDVVGDDSGR